MNIGLIKTIGKSAMVAGKTVGTIINRHSPEILVGAGIVGGAATTVMACKATVKIVDIKLENVELSKTIDNAEQIMDQRKADIIVDENGKEYSREDVENDRLAIRSQTIMAYIKGYAPVAALGVASAVSILCGVNILNKRNMMLVAAYTSLERSYGLYRKRVIEDLGEDADWKYRTGATTKKIEQDVVDEKTGEVKRKKVKTEVIEEGNDAIDYTINLGRECKAPFVKDAIDYTRTYTWLDMVETTATNEVKLYGWKSLNDIRRELYCPPVAIGQIAGWSREDWDGYVSFNAREVYDEELGKNTIILDPNVDGAIINKIDGYQAEQVEANKISEINHRAMVKARNRIRPSTIDDFDTGVQVEETYSEPDPSDFM